MTQDIVKNELHEEILLLRVQKNKIYQNVIDDLRQQLQHFCQASITKHVILDLSKVEVINSSGIGVLIMLADKMRKEERVLYVVGLKPLLKELFQRMRLETIFKICAHETEAINSIKQ